MEFENLQIEVQAKDESSPIFGAKVYEKKYKNKKDFVVGFNPYDQEHQKRKNLRAKRFGIKESEKIIEPTINELTKTTAGVTTDENETDEAIKSINKKQELNVEFFQQLDLKSLQWPSVPDSALEEMRLDAIHVYGVDHMNTKDIFEYFKLFGPDELEWIDDFSCNVVWTDGDSVVKAMDTMSRTFHALKVLQKQVDSSKLQSTNTEVDVRQEQGLLQSIKIEEEDEIQETNPSVLVEDDEDDIDPKDVWRVAYPYGEYQLFLRPATIKDKKLPGAASRSQYYLLYGKNGGKKGIVSKSRKRKLEVMKKRAEEVFKTKDPAVQILPLEEIKKDVNKIEVDDRDQGPVIKRLNMDTEKQNTRTMIADRVEVSNRLGDRLGLRLRDDDDDDETEERSVYDRLGHGNHRYSNGDDDNRDDARQHLREKRGGKSVHARLGRRETQENADKEDARKDIEKSRGNRINVLREGYRETGYEDSHGIYHDIYRADDNKNSNDNNSDNENRHNRTTLSLSSSKRKPDSRHEMESSNRLKSRLGRTNTDRNSSLNEDLRGRLKKNDKRERSKSTKQPQEIKMEEAEDEYAKDKEKELLNLCIEIKQESDDEMDIGIEMDAGDEFDF